jgi:hypothetical protein
VIASAIGLDERAGIVAVGMERLTRLALALGLLAALFGASPALAQTIKLFLNDGSAVDLYEDKKSFALVIGINEYRKQRRLNFAVSDARKVARELEEKGFEVILYDDPNLTGEHLRDAIQDFVDEYGYIENSRILIWYAGHGMTIDGEGYLLGVDAPVLDIESATLDQDLRTFYNAAMPLRSFGVHLRQMRTRHVMLVLDSCFAGTIFTNTRANPSVTRNREMARPARQIITAGLAGEEVADNGRFAEMFIRAINGEPGPNGEIADQSRDNYLSGTELGNFLAVAARSSDQTPQYGKLRREIDQSLAEPRGLFVTDQLDLEKGEFFFLLPDFEPPAEVADTGTFTVASRGPEPVIWRPLTSGTRIANTKPDPVPVFDTEPPVVGERKFALNAGQVFPPVGGDTVFEQATIGEREWLKFKHENRDHFVLASDVEIIRPN